MNSDWTFAVVTESQRFVCATSMEGTLDESPRQARALRDAIPPPPDSASAAFLRSTLLELAVRWGTEQHHRLGHKCQVRPCHVAALADPAPFWPSPHESAGVNAADSFVAYVTAVRDELADTHGPSLAERAVALLANSSGRMTVESAARMLGAHPSTLRRAFRRDVGMSARQFLATKRRTRREPRVTRRLRRSA